MIEFKFTVTLELNEDCNPEDRDGIIANMLNNISAGIVDQANTVGVVGEEYYQFTKTIKVESQDNNTENFVSLL